MSELEDLQSMILGNRTAEALMILRGQVTDEPDSAARASHRHLQSVFVAQALMHGVKETVENFCQFHSELHELDDAGLLDQLVASQLELILNAEEQERGT